MVSGDVLLSHTVASAVPSALRGLTAVFGMGTGVSPSLGSPEKTNSKNRSIQERRQPNRFCRDKIRRPAKPLNGQAERPISTGQLKTSRPLHLPPINLVISQGSSGRPHLRGGFALRCFQRLSFPNVATQPCHWRDNWCTRGSSVPVLSY